MKDFIKINETFKCKNCGYLVPKASKTCRNHCPKCLTSLHVDITPGDRKEVCHGLMRPVNYEYIGGEIIIHFVCEKCGIKRRNKAASDDDISQIIT